MIKQLWVVMPITVIDSLWAGMDIENPVEIADGVTGVRGTWANISPNEVICVIGDNDSLNSFTAANAADIVSVDGWLQGIGVDDLDDYPTDPARVLSLMPAGASFNNPIWPIVYFGMEPEKLIFAGEFTDEFSQEFL